MEFDAHHALIHLLWLGASVDNEIADSEREYIQTVSNHEKIPLDIEGLLIHHKNHQTDLIYQACITEINQHPQDERLKIIVYLFEMLLSDDLFLEEEDHFFRKVIKDLHISEEQFRHAPSVF